MSRALALAFLLVANTGRAETLHVHDEVASQRRERVTCSIAAALKFGVPMNIMLAIAEMEGGRPGQQVRNLNGSLDVGPMQFNTRYLKHLERQYGITAADVAAAGCYPYELAAWRLRKHLELDCGDVWTRAANYHSRSPTQNSKYRRKLIAKATAWARRLSDRVPTHEARIASPRGCRSNKERRGQRKPTRQADNAGELVPDVEDDGADLLRLLNAVSNDDGMYPVIAPASGSVGAAHTGSLRRGVQLPAHDGYVVRDPSRAWGTADTIHRLTSAFDEVTRAAPFAPRVRVHDLSLQHGGPMRSHKSHQSGRDVDLTYYQRTCKRECTGRPVSARDFDARRQWRLLRYWLERGDAQFIFIDHALQRPLYEQARSAGATPRQLVRWFQYPRGRALSAGIIRHTPGHANHVHVRFRCTRRDRACQPIPARPLPKAREGLSPPFTPAEDDSELLELLTE